MRSGSRRPDLMRVESQEAEAEQTADQLEQLAGLREEQLRILIGAGSGEGSSRSARTFAPRSPPVPPTRSTAR